MHGQEGKFVINATSGIITTAGALDRETKDSYTVYMLLYCCLIKRVMPLTVCQVFSHQCGPGSSHIETVFVAGYHLTPRVFLRFLRFSSHPKSQHFQIAIGPR